MKKVAKVKVESIEKAKWVNGRAFYKGVSAEKAKLGLQKVAARHSGQLTPKTVLEDARNKDSVLHRCFEWNDGKAAEEFRILQARDLIRSVYVQVGDAPQYAAWVSVEKGNRRVYMSLPAVLDDTQLREGLLAEAMDYITSFQQRFDTLEELRPIFQAMDRVVKKVKKRGRRAA